MSNLNFLSSITDRHRSDVKDWWYAFKKEQERISALFSQNSSESFDLLACMNENVSHINENIMWEFGPGIKK